MQKHTVDQDRKDFSPGHRRDFHRDPEGFTLRLMFDGGSWFDPTPNGPLGRDGKDWNKAGGLTTFHPWKWWTWKNNASAALVGFRPHNTPGMWEIAGYVNDEHGGHRAELLGIVGSSTETRVVCKIGSKRADYYLGERTVRLPFDPQPFAYAVGPWFGGTLPAHLPFTLYAEQS